MNVWVLLGMAFMAGGILLIASTFLIQKKEDKERMPGFYTSAAILEVKPQKAQHGQTAEQVAVTFAFTKEFRILHRTYCYSKEEAKDWVPGRNTLIVYDEACNKIYVNPMKKYRKQQAVLMLAGGLTVLFGIFWTITFYGFVAA